MLQNSVLEICGFCDYYFSKRQQIDSATASMTKSLPFTSLLLVSGCSEPSFRSKTKTTHCNKQIDMNLNYQSA